MKALETMNTRRGKSNFGFWVCAQRTEAKNSSQAKIKCFRGISGARQAGPIYLNFGWYDLCIR